MLGQGSEETKAACPVGPPIDSRGRVVATGLVLHGLFDRSVSTAAEEILISSTTHHHRWNLLFSGH